MRNKNVLKISSVLLAILLWQAAAMIIDQKVLIASPVSVLARLAVIWKEDGFFPSVLFSFSRIALGFLLGLVVGILLAILAGRFKILETLFMPYFVTIKSIPVASFIIISLIWLSSRELSVFISFLIVLPVIYNNVLQGIRSTDTKMVEMANVFNITWLKRLRYIFMPQLMPYLISACATALGLAWKSGIAAEIIGIPDGSMGEMLYNAKVYLNTVDLFAWTVIIVAVSVIFEKLFIFLLRLVYKRLLRS